MQIVDLHLHHKDFLEVQEVVHTTQVVAEVLVDEDIMVQKLIQEVELQETDQVLKVVDMVVLV
jgi:hypothetical protein